MSGQFTTAPQEPYEGFEIHVAPNPTQADSLRYTYTDYVCHPGADLQSPSHIAPSHVDGDDTSRNPEEAMEEAVYMACNVIDSTHPDLSMLSIVTYGY